MVCVVCMYEMPKNPAKLQDQGRVTIDIDIRRELGLEKGDYVMIDVEPLSEVNDE